MRSLVGALAIVAQLSACDWRLAPRGTAPPPPRTSSAPPSRHPEGQVTLGALLVLVGGGLIVYDVTTESGSEHSSFDADGLIGVVGGVMLVGGAALIIHAIAGS